MVAKADSLHADLNTLHGLPNGLLSLGVDRERKHGDDGKHKFSWTHTKFLMQMRLLHEGRRRYLEWLLTLEGPPFLYCRSCQSTSFE